jgi:hypothetical protein
MPILARSSATAHGSNDTGLITCESVTQVRSREEHRRRAADTHKVDGTMRLSATLSRHAAFQR